MSIRKDARKDIFCAREARQGRVKVSGPESQNPPAGRPEDFDVMKRLGFLRGQFYDIFFVGLVPVFLISRLIKLNSGFLIQCGRKKFQENLDFSART